MRNRGHMVVDLQIVLIILAIILGIALTISSETDEDNQRGFSFRPVRLLVRVVLFFASIFLSMAVGQINRHIYSLRNSDRTNTRRNALFCYSFRRICVGHGFTYPNSGGAKGSRV